MPYARYVGPAKGFRGDAGIYHLDEPYFVGERGTAIHAVIASTVDLPFIGRWETMIFPATKDGKVLSWRDLAGGYETTVTQAFEELGYTVMF